MIRISSAPQLTCGPAFLKAAAIPVGIQGCDATNWLETIGSQKVKMPPTNGPVIDASPPMTAPTSSWNDRASGNVSGLTNPMLNPYRAPPMPAYKAEMPNAMVLYAATLLPDAAAAA